MCGIALVSAEGAGVGSKDSPTGFIAGSVGWCEDILNSVQRCNSRESNGVRDQGGTVLIARV